MSFLTIRAFDAAAQPFVGFGLDEMAQEPRVRVKQHLRPPRETSMVLSP